MPETISFGGKKKLKQNGFSHVFLVVFRGHQVPPLLGYLPQVHLVHGHPKLPDNVVPGKPVEIVNGQDQYLAAYLVVRYLCRN